MISHEHYSAHKDNTSVEQKVIRYSMPVSMLMSMIRFFSRLRLEWKLSSNMDWDLKGYVSIKTKKLSITSSVV